MKNKNISLLDALTKAGAVVGEDQEKFIKALEIALEARQADADESYSESFKAALSEAMKGLEDEDGNTLTIAKALKKIEDKVIEKAQFDELKEQVAKLKEASSTNTVEVGDLFEAIEKGLKDFLPMVKKAAAANNSLEKEWELELEVKAPVNMLTTAITNNSNTPVSYVYQQVTAFSEDVRKREYIINYLSNGTTSKVTLPYMDKLPTEGTMAITAEGALKPLISVSFVLRYSTAKKMAGRTKISEEALDDIPYIMSIIRNELSYQHDIAVQADIFTTVAGFAPGFVAGALAATTTNPSNYDAVRAAIYAVKIASKGLYVPNAVLIASSDVYAMGATKDANNNYVFPPFVMPDGTTISGVRIVEVEDGETVPAGTFIVGDWKKLHRDVYKGFTVRIGQGIQGNATAANIVSDFESNMYTIIGESRYHLWIYENEKVAFIKSTFAAVKTAIAAA
jgi:hypothetical protein